MIGVRGGADTHALRLGWRCLPAGNFYRMASGDQLRFNFFAMVALDFNGAVFNSTAT